MNWSQQGCLQPLLMVSYISVNLIGFHWIHWCTTTCWLAYSDMCLSSFQLDSVIYYTLTSIRAQLSQLGFWSVVKLSVDRYSVKLDSLIQFEWPPWEFEMLWNSCFQHDHCIVLLILYWLYKWATHFVAPLYHFHALFSEISYETVFYSLDYCAY